MGEQRSRVRLTAGRMADFACSPGKSQSFLWDTDTPTLALRASPSGRKTFVFESRLDGNTVRIPIGTIADWAIEKARARAQSFKVLVDSGVDPRELERDKQAAKAAREVAAASAAIQVSDVWPRYMTEGKPKRKNAWKPRYVADLQRAASLGGEAKKRGKGLTKPGHLAALMPMTLASIDQDVIRDWYAREAKSAPIQAARAVAMFSGFLSWCATKKELRGLVNKDAAKASELGDVLPGVSKRRDALEIDQLRAWFAGTDKLRSRQAAAYLQVLVLTGARREELAGLKWTDVDTRWSKLTIADKVDATRVIPLTPYVAWLLSGLVKGQLPDGTPNPYVFSSPKSASGRIAEPRAPHAEVLEDAGIPHVSIHGLRRTFSLLGEAAGAPAGAIAQVMGHKPSAIAEGYRPRSIDALRPYLAQIEAFILDKAGIPFDSAAAKAGPLKLVPAA